MRVTRVQGRPLQLIRAHPAKCPACSLHLPTGTNPAALPLVPAPTAIQHRVELPVDGVPSLCELAASSSHG
eukprot:170265-Amphidinium_carterae.2